MATKIEHRIIIDIVPFTLDIKYIYTPLSYLDREILGYHHYYAFRENYAEEDDLGRVRYAHDYDLIAEKIAPYCEFSYSSFFALNRQTINFTSSSAEIKTYNLYREQLFEERLKGNVIATKLADLIHDFESRKTITLELLSKLNSNGKTRILFNLTSYAKKFQSRCKRQGFKKIECVSYALGSALDYSDVDNLIYLEYPIVKSYFLLDIEAKLSEQCRVYHIRSDAKVDSYLANKLNREIEQIAEFIKIFNLVSKSNKSPQTNIQLNLFDSDEF